MGMTNFNRLVSEQKTVWSREVLKQARDLSVSSRYIGTSANSMFQRVTELTASEKGTRAVITLVPDGEQDGVVGDRHLVGNEESLKAFDQVIQLDQLRHGHRNSGRMADQATVVNFRKTARDALAYWMANRVDQLVFLTLAGIDYSVRNDGGLRPLGNQLHKLEFAKDVTPPTDRRVYAWHRDSPTTSTGTLVQGAASSTVEAGDYLSWDALVKLKTQARVNRIKPVRGSGGSEVYHVFLSPLAYEKLKLDPRYWEAVKGAYPRASDNPLFTGEGVLVDGLHLHENFYVPNTMNAPSGSKYGNTGTVDGCQVLLCGAQALAIAEIGEPIWEEEGFDYENEHGISVGRIFGLLKPRFYTQYSGHTVQDHGVISLYVAQ